MQPKGKKASKQRETGRVEAFSDCVFAIAITLLVLELKVPPVDQITDRQALGDALLHLWPSFAAFLTSFSAILIMWMNHLRAIPHRHGVGAPEVGLASRPSGRERASCGSSMPVQRR